jgi:hypothetical protein
MVYTSANFDTTPKITNEVNNLNAIFNAETTRLNTKQSSIDQALTSQDRLVSLNQSYSQRLGQYTYMIIIIIIALVLILGILMVQPRLEAIPSGFFTFLIIIIIGSAFIYCIILYNNIQGRSNMNYDELNLSVPTPVSADQLAAKNAANLNSGNLIGNTSGCIGQECCSTGTYWSDASQNCKPGTDPETFTTLQFSAINEPTAISSKIQPYTENEFDVYALYK